MEEGVSNFRFSISVNRVIEKLRPEYGIVPSRLRHSEVSLLGDRSDGSRHSDITNRIFIAELKIICRWLLEGEWTRGWQRSNIIDIDLFHLFLLVKVEVVSLFFILLITLRGRVALALGLVVTLHELNSACRSVLIFIDLQVLRDFTLSLQLPNFIRKIFENDVALLVLKLS